MDCNLVEWWEGGGGNGGINKGERNTACTLGIKKGITLKSFMYLG
jgi:hypothetical protein